MMRCLLLFLCAGSIACSSTPEHRVDFPGADPRALGSVRITDTALERIEVENTGRQAIDIVAVVLGSGWDGVLSIDADSTGCVPGQTLQRGEHCIVAIAFEPMNDVTYRDALHVDYQPQSGGEPIRTTLSIQGAGLLDCTVNTELTQSYDEGVANAEAQIAADINEATAAGAALTREDGYADTYSTAYDAAYNRAYTLGYDGGFAEGYDVGYGDGASVTACLDGENDGYADGYAGGVPDGEFDGAADGDTTGYNDGYATGCIDGEFDSCGFNTKDLDPSLPGKCVDQGYNSTYSRTHYDNAFAEAVAANADYQDGVAAGNSEGEAAGLNDGDADGYADGYREGVDAGFVDGDTDQYEACYFDAFDLGYQDGYVDGYDTLFSVAYEEGFAIGYEDGYANGFLICSF